MMLGDWYVCYNDHQDLCYRQMTEKDFAIPDEKLTVHNYSPVELTEEILLKNGFFDAPNNIFLLAEIDDNGDKKISIKMKKGKYRIDITNDDHSIVFKTSYPPYVHQLQQYMRQLWFTKEIVL